MCRMPTSSGSTRTRVERKISESKNRPSAETVPSQLLLYAFCYLDDYRTLIATQQVCRAWRASKPSILEQCWRPLYFHDFEAESATDACIMTQGDRTPWQERYHRRILLERNWTNNRETN